MLNSTVRHLIKLCPDDYEVIMIDYMNKGKIVSVSVDHIKKIIYLNGTEKN